MTLSCLFWYMFTLLLVQAKVFILSYYYHQNVYISSVECLDTDENHLKVYIHVNICNS